MMRDAYATTCCSGHDSGVACVSRKQACLALLYLSGIATVVVFWEDEVGTGTMRQQYLSRLCAVLSYCMMQSCPALQRHF